MSPPINKIIRTLASRFVPLLAAALLTGCLAETRYTSAPGASGRVVDSVDHRPIPGATVTLIPEEFSASSDKIVPIEVQTSGQGTFRIHQQTDWIVYEAGSPGRHTGLCAAAVLRIQHPGYETLETNIADGPFQIGPVIDDFKAGDIRLEKEPEK